MHDVLVGINLLREGLDMPEVSLVAILDADKEGFLRSERSLIQTFGRAARNANGRVICYADSITKSLQKAMSETERRRKIQVEYNKKHGITPQTITKEIRDMLFIEAESDYVTVDIEAETDEKILPEKIPSLINDLTKKMKEAAKKMDFEKAVVLRDRIKKLSERQLQLGIMT